MINNKCKVTFFPIAPVMIRHGSMEKRVLALLDSGSSVTLIDDQLAKELGVTGPVDTMSLSGTDGRCGEPFETEGVEITLRSVYTGREFTVIAQTKDDLILPHNNVTSADLQEEELSHLPIDRDQTETPRILIGQDNAALMRTFKSQEGISGTVVASETPFGWVIEGTRRIVTPVCLVVNANSDSRMEAMLLQYINDERFGLQPDGDVQLDSDDNIRARKLMNQNTHFDEAAGRYETGLLWKDDNTKLPNNRASAVKRLLQFEKKLAKDPQLRVKVNELMASYVQKGYSRPVSESSPESDRTWYLPLFAVNNPHKPHKTRMVMDAAALHEWISLNMALLSGPDLTRPLISCLMKLRTWPVALTGDIEEMFHQVMVRLEDRASQRYLWRSDPSQPIQEYEMCVLTFGATCSPTLAQYAKNINAERFRDEFPAAVEAIIKQHYVDDYMGGAYTVRDTIKLAREVKEIHRRGGFHMHKWSSNSAAVLKALGDAENQGKEVSLSNSTILGLLWNTTDDTLSFRFNIRAFRDAQIDDTRPLTKREMLIVVMSIYAPWD